MALTFPRNLFMEMYLNNKWQSVMTYVRQTTAIKIIRGKGNEQGEVAPATLTCKFENATGDLNPDNPLGQWFGQLKRNTPVRFGLTTSSDTFSRTVVNSWGTTDTGEVWDNAGSGGSVLASDWNVAAGVATHSVPAVAAYRRSIIPVNIADVEVACTTTVPIMNISGGPIEPCNLVCRWIDSSNFYMARVEISATEIATMTIRKFVAGVETVLATLVSGDQFGTVAQTKTVRVKMQAEGQTIRMKAYVPGNPVVDENAGWDLEVHDTSLSAPGSAGVRSGVSGTNTNTLPIIFSNDSFEVRKLRFSGETVELKPRWNTTHTDKWVELIASTLLRRFKQGKTPLKSTLRRAYEAGKAANLVQYWPAEEEADAKQITSIIDTNHMLVTGRPQYGQFTDFLSSSPLPKMNGSTWSGNITPYAATGQAQIRFLIAAPKDEIADNTVIADVECTGTLRKVRILYRTGGGLSVNGYNAAGALIGVAGGAVSLNINGGLTRVQLQLTQNGANVDYGISRYDLADDVIGGASGSIAGTLGIPYRFTQNPLTGPPTLTGTACGHITVQSLKTSDFELTTEYRAYRGDTPIDRLTRLGDENGFNTGYIGSSSRYPMGPQLPTVLYTLLKECQDSVQGTLYESLFTGNTLILRTVNATHSQTAKLVLNYTGNQIVPPLQPNTDDQPIANDITVKRLVGGEFRIRQLTGPLNVQDPWATTDTDAVGVYDRQVPANTQFETQLPDIGGWALHIGTTEAPRFSKLRLNLRELSDAVQLQVLDLSIDDRITVQSMGVAGYFDDIDLLALGYTETYLDQYQHDIEFNCAPYEPYNTGVYNDNDSKYSPQSATLNAGITAVATTLTNAGSLWTTTAGQFPFDIDVEGERMTVTNIVGAAIPQTFTVTRNVNGAAKAHSAGAKIKIAKKIYYGR